ncbi:hypothetical protein BGP77_11055 [Saccharospirillum sp. MSK14-1]|uniref:DUF262 domain-containing protein n=1 Tax=Saccharospirillum sp. MSK14-1 TaxID=1897632 RepID=UPI000D3CE0B0|nr:DUF262 domain-containing protein [Saccharospirillum sp. MSK14-1]PTY38710.1 hypothetical protein BGP77_11055 [Saccharospirillum sp. MSK14-1]
MENRVYYGEYSLKHWITLVLRRNIILPKYQRYFVWNENKVKNLIDAFRSQQFIPPVTIGAFNSNGENKNLILDGQQRVTSIVLAHLDLFPDVQTYRKAVEKFANDNDDDDNDPCDDDQLDNILEWNVSRLTDRGKSKEEILNNIPKNNYKYTTLSLSDEFLENNFLGFSYLVPKTSDENEQQRYYSSVFRNINVHGEPLLPQESRASLYFLDQDLVQLFSPEFSKKLLLKSFNHETKSDFLRYLSLLSQYHKNGDEKKVARSYKQRMESYYEEYIYTAINNDDSAIFGRFTDIFKDKAYEEKLARLEQALNDLGYFKTYNSIIEIDTYLFGLIYYILFLGKTIRVDSPNEIIEKLDMKVEDFKNTTSHQKNPNNLGHLRNRIKDSISIYRYLITNEKE